MQVDTGKIKPMLLPLLEDHGFIRCGIFILEALVLRAIPKEITK